METNPLVSMIIPAYNAEYNLPRLFKSIKNQTYENLEVIIVNYGSVDCTKQYCEEFAEKQKNVRVVSMLNAGISMARNKGMDFAHGKYIVFCGQGDWYTTNGIKLLADRIESTGSDFCMGGITRLDYKKTDRIGATKSFDPLGTSEERLEFIGMIDEGAAVNGKMFKRELIEKIGLQFPQGMHFSEDLMFVYQYMPLCRKFCSTDAPVYYYSKVASKYDDTRYYRLMSSWMYNLNVFYVRNLSLSGVDPEKIPEMRTKSVLEAFGRVCRYYAMWKEEDGHSRYIGYLHEAVEIFTEELAECEKYVDRAGTGGMTADDLEMMRRALHESTEDLAKMAESSYDGYAAAAADKKRAGKRKKNLPVFRRSLYRLKIGYND